MPLGYPPVVAKGDGGEVANANIVRQALIDAEARLVALEERCAQLEARPTFKVATSEPAHDGSQRNNDLYIKKT